MAGTYTENGQRKKNKASGIRNVQAQTARRPSYGRTQARIVERAMHYGFCERQRILEGESKSNETSKADNDNDKQQGSTNKTQQETERTRSRNGRKHNVRDEKEQKEKRR